MRIPGMMRGGATIPKPLLATLAALFAAVATLYGGLWMYEERTLAPGVELGFNRTHSDQYERKTHSIHIGDVLADSPAERAGLKAGDRIVGVNGTPLLTPAPFDEAYAKGHPGDPVELTIARPGEAAPVNLRAIFRARQPTQAAEGLARTSAQQILSSFPVLFLIVGFMVLFLRLEDPSAWLLALMFAAFAAAPGISSPSALAPRARTFMFAYRAVFHGLLSSLFYVFFAVFPQRSPLERRFPWLKWAGLAVAAAVVVPGLGTGELSFPSIVEQLLGERGSEMLLQSTRYGLIALGMISLAENSFASSVSLEARRKSKVILWGTLVGVLPTVTVRAFADFAEYQPSFWLNAGTAIIFILYPLSFAYAVVKHRVMEIPVLLRRSARYVLVQRGFIVLLFAVAASAIALFTHVFARLAQSYTNLGMALSAVFGVVLVWVSSPLVKRGTDRIDRAFFRSAYDARVILQDLAEKMRTVSERRDVARLLEGHIGEALHPKMLVCYLDAGNDRLRAVSGNVPAPLEMIPASAPVFAEAARRGKSWDVLPNDSNEDAGITPLEALAPECLVPILGRESQLIGMLVLGQRLSEESYTSEDEHLLDSVAGQAGIALENIRLAEKMAERLEADRRAARDMEIARQVQARLFPQKLPEMKRLVYTGGCLPAREVGGDYYDFLELRPGRLGLVLADIAGKGVSGALLMANLQANLRSQYAMAVDDLARLLTSVNHLFYENTDDASYATLFFADYDDSTRNLRYANCGHWPGVMLRADGKADWLRSTCTVMGLFETWECKIAEAKLGPGDTLVLYTDGVTEASNAEQEEFGQMRLLETLQRHSRLGVEELMKAVLEAVQRFSGGKQEDDITLIVARAAA